MGMGLQEGALGWFDLISLCRSLGESREAGASCLVPPFLAPTVVPLSFRAVLPVRTTPSRSVPCQGRWAGRAVASASSVALLVLPLTESHTSAATSRRDHEPCALLPLRAWKAGLRAHVQGASREREFGIGDQDRDSVQDSALTWRVFTPSQVSRKGKITSTFSKHGNLTANELHGVYI